jgi:hypothetical protein
MFQPPKLAETRADLQVSTALAGGVIVSAFNQRANFYSACVYLAQSNLCLMVGLSSSPALEVADQRTDSDQLDPLRL